MIGTEDCQSILRRIRYDYNKNGWRIRKEEGVQGNGTVDETVTTYGYDENGNLIKTITPGGFKIRRSYDANDRLVEERTLDWKNGIDRTLCYTYDAAGNLLEETLQGVDMEPLRTRYHYDLKNRQTHEINPSGGVKNLIIIIMIAYQPFGRSLEPLSVRCVWQYVRESGGCTKPHPVYQPVVLYSDRLNQIEIWFSKPESCWNE